MRTRKVPIKSSRFCALCKHWYDPANSHLRPVVPMIGQWEIDTDTSVIADHMSLHGKEWHYDGF